MKLFGMFQRNKMEQPRASYQSASGGVLINTSEQLEQALTAGVESASGQRVTPDSAMGVAAVYACVRIISGAVATMPIHIKKRIDERTREDYSEHSLWKVLRRKPNSWQKPAQFRRMMQTHVLLRGNAYAMIVRSRGQVTALIPMHPDQVECKQDDDLSLVYIYTRRDGKKVKLKQQDVFHLVGLTLDGVHGVSVLKFARETIGLSLSMEKHGSNLFKNGAQVSSLLVHPEKLGKEGAEFLRESLAEYRSGGESEGKTMILEENMTYTPIGMTSEDAQWIESRKFSRSEIAMFFGVPPSMMGDNTGSDSNWGTGLEQKSLGFVAYTLEDHLTMWEEGINVDLISENEPNVYSKFNRSSLVKGDIKSRWEAHTKSLQWGVQSPNEIRALEDLNPREGGDVYYDPPNTAGGSEEGSENDDVTQDARN